jgi:hypothetical protein
VRRSSRTPPAFVSIDASVRIDGCARRSGFTLAFSVFSWSPFSAE